MRKTSLIALAVLFVASQAVTSSQSPSPAQSAVRIPQSATDVPLTDIRAVIKAAPADGILDQQIRVVDMGKYNVAVGVLHRSAKPAQQGAIDHAQVTEVYHIIEGRDVLTGGTITNARPIAKDNDHDDPGRPEHVGATIQGGQSAMSARRRDRHPAGRGALVQRGRERHELSGRAWTAIKICRPATSTRRSPHVDERGTRTPERIVVAAVRARSARSSRARSIKAVIACSR